MYSGFLRSRASHEQNMERSSNFSPGMQRSVMRPKFAARRLHQWKTSLISCCVALVFLIIEIFLLDSYIGFYLLGECMPWLMIVLCEYALLIYMTSIVLWIISQVLFCSSTQGLVRASFGMILPSPSNATSKIPSDFKLLDTSHSADVSWIDDHHFGIPAEKNSSYSHNCYTSNNSDHSAYITGSPRNALPDNVVMSRSSPFNKSIDSIHTRDQLDYLLSKESSSHIDTGARNSSFTYFNVLDIGAPDEEKCYQVSKQIGSSDLKDNIVVKMGAGNRVILSTANSDTDGEDEMTKLRHALQHAKHSPKKVSGLTRFLIYSCVLECIPGYSIVGLNTISFLSLSTVSLSNVSLFYVSYNTGSLLFRRESIELRRRSIASPERPLRTTNSGSIPGTTDIDRKSSYIHEIDFVRGEQRLRSWIVNTILEPLDRRIKETNLKLEKEHTSPPLRIGLSSVETLQAALVSRPELLDTMLPYIVPFLSVHNNQIYLVSRLSELAGDKFMMEFTWNSGGKEPIQDKGGTIDIVTTSCRLARRPWGEHLPTDAVLVFSLFSTYMDTQLTSNPLVGTCRLAQPFSALYTLKAPQKPNAVHLAAESFYLHMSSISPPHIDFVFNDADGSPSRAAIPRGMRNLFAAILSFINYAKVNNGGRLDRMSIGPTGLNIACVLE